MTPRTLSPSLLVLALLACSGDPGPGASAPGSESPGREADPPAAPEIEGGAAGDVPRPVSGTSLLESRLAGGAAAAGTGSAVDGPATGDPADPAGWVTPQEHLGVPVEVRREFGGRDGALTRIRTVTRDGGVDHGPEWLFHETLGMIQVKQTFDMGVLDGPFADWFENGLPRREGAYVDGLMSGTWKRWDKDGTLIGIREYLAGEPHGTFTTWFRSGEPKTYTEYLEGRKHGVDRELDREGHIVFETLYSNGLQDGEHREHFPASDQVFVEGQYAAGVKVGAWRTYDEAGNLLREETWVDGQLEGPLRTWYPSGALESESVYVQGLEEGPQVGYYEDGTRQRQGEMRAGQREGEWTFWKPDGTVDEAWSGQYRDGNLVREEG